MSARRVSLKGKGADLFFGAERAENGSAGPVAEVPAEETQAVPAAPPLPTDDPTSAVPPAAPPADQGTPPALPRTRRASRTASPQASTIARYRAAPEMVAAIRKTLKAPGREVSFVRLTAEEKRQLADVVYSYKRQGHRTSETEINRIAVNFLLEDHRAHGRHSILATVIDALTA